MANVYPELKKLTSVLEIRSATKLGLRFPGRLGQPPSRQFLAVRHHHQPLLRRPRATYMLAGGSPAFRHLAKPATGEVLIEADWSAQEIWIAAYLSGDKAMQKMLQQADPYIAFGEMCGMIPAGSLGKARRRGMQAPLQDGTRRAEGVAARRPVRQERLHRRPGLRHHRRRSQGAAAISQAPVSAVLALDRVGRQRIDSHPQDFDEDGMDRGSFRPRRSATRARRTAPSRRLRTRCRIFRRSRTAPRCCGSL